MSLQLYHSLNSALEEVSHLKCLLSIIEMKFLKGRPRRLTVILVGAGL